VWTREAGRKKKNFLLEKRTPRSTNPNYGNGKRGGIYIVGDRAGFTSHSVRGGEEKKTI